MFKVVKEIKSKTGELHFRRYSIFQCKYFNIYIHRIFKSDEDKHKHNHPWNFISVILWGGYIESVLHMAKDTNLFIKYRRQYIRKFLNIGYRNFKDYHQFKLLKITTTLVITGPRTNTSWGYYVDGTHICSDEYRNLKNKGILNDDKQNI